MAPTINTRVNQFCFGQPKTSLSLEKEPLKPLAQGKVRVRLEATNINPSDLLSIHGVGQYRRIHIPPRVPGFEAVGRVVEVSAVGHAGFQVGQKVLVAMSGTWQYYIDASPENLFPLPESLDNGYACQLYINALTAWVITTKVAKLNKEDVVIINAAGSTIGKIFAQLAHSLGFTLIAVTSKPDEYPYDTIPVLDAKKDLHAQLQTRKLPQPTVALDAIGGEAGTDLIRTLKENGQYINYGTLSLAPYTPVFFESMKTNNIDFSTFFLRYWEESVGKGARKRVFAEMLKHFIANDIKLAVAHYLPLEAFQTAIEQIEEKSLARSGKIILTM
ncbi:zinc-dependent alcohol dehydrogenase family protein [Vibrio parahaemolyticus]|uniref:zinc-dependent alcohol dehydrogenase family protein n=1 Tax=Vibrio parahaemolyticus TaxID=670 RepID=UPI0029EBABBB|nr:zinc-dependent alcohol dehydrogenase family protein [Vibrio parahaemolyticus]MBE4374053.1 zinc-dependent alcohol dehydrogenase family protein [Vibrio parahaemolyticus]MEA5236374.1 zinc-dependent alcohol dehydrogenase family protein [Vibrio parahaemolyticus]HCG9721783.1 zinc-dependent alcohol dehydrogenase family protein [Vibrio parahaemolyticus]HCG9725507.1 zinc-dependent alcohol dehydrogenase family protein [Vibrio parahaemolyticus]